MPITITSDPILEVSELKEITGINSDTKATVLINSVSKKFLNFTQRTHINQASAPIEELSRGDGTSVIWLRAYATSVTEVAIMSDGAASTTYSSSDYGVDADGPRVVLYNVATPISDAEDNVRVTYTPGWDEIPGDIILAALEQIIHERDRLAGKQVGMTSESLGKHTASYETGGLLESVQDAWQPYRIMR